MASISPIAKRSPGPEAPAAAGQSEIDLLMRRFFDQTQDEIAKPVQSKPPAPPATSPRNFDTAAEILDRASQAFDILIGRCRRLEQILEQEAERASAHAAEQDEAIEQWKRLASGLKVQVETSEREAAMLKQRCVAAEARATQAETRVTTLEKASAQAVGQAALASNSRPSCMTRSSWPSVSAPRLSRAPSRCHPGSGGLGQGTPSGVTTVRRCTLVLARLIALWDEAPKALKRDHAALIQANGTERFVLAGCAWRTMRQMVWKVERVRAVY